MVKAHVVAFFSGVDVSDTCDGAKTSKCHRIRLHKGEKVSIGKLKQPRTSTHSTQYISYTKFVQQGSSTFSEIERSQHTKLKNNANKNKTSKINGQIKQNNFQRKSSEVSSFFSFSLGNVFPFVFLQGLELEGTEISDF